MFVSEKFLYIELPKTACSQIRDFLKHLAGGENIGKHNRPSQDLLDSERAVIGSIRNPWDWYVSLWAFGCDSKGVLHKRLTSRKLRGNSLLGSHASAMRPYSVLPFLLNNLLKPCGDWERLYSDSKDPVLFREWLCKLLDTRSGTKYTLGDGYAFSPLSSYAGLYTFYYLQLFLQNDLDLFGDKVENLEKLKSLDEENNVLDYVISVENLESDLIKTLSKIGFEFDKKDIVNELRTFKPSWHKDKGTLTNSSSRVRDYRYYYDSDTTELVHNLEKHIVLKYGYSFADVAKVQ